MPKALDRLLASPSALRTLRAIVSSPDLPSICLLSTNCRRATTNRRPYSSKPKPATYAHPRSSSYKYAVFRPSGIEREGSVDRLGLNREEPPTAGEPATEERLWVQELVQFLQYKERLHGVDGLPQIWTGLVERGFMLPTASTPEAGLIWGTFLKEPTLFEPLLAHAERQLQQTGQTYPHLYEKCMQYWLPRQPRRAMRYHHLLVLKLKLKALPLLKIAQSTKLNSRALETFMEMYKTSNERDLYDAMVPTLHEQGKFEFARRWHTICYHRQDLPSSVVATHPVVQLLLAETQSSPRPNKPQLPAAPSAEKDSKLSVVLHSQERSQPDIPMYNEDLLRRLQRRDIEPVRFDDTFCARLFATKAFPPSSVIDGLKMVGVNEIGPQAVRAMAMRTEPLSELSDMFRQLRAAGITLQGSVFSVALEKFAMENNLRLMQSMIESDQHADVFEDRNMQEKLLDHYLKESDWLQVYRTLAILSLVYNDSRTESWNLLFRARIRQIDRWQVAHVLEDLRANRVMLSSRSIFTVKYLLPRRQRGRRPQPRANGNVDELRFVTRTYMTILESSVGVLTPHTWREIIRRYGMTGRFRELQRLIYWLLSWYAPRDGNPKFALLPKSRFLDSATEAMRRTFPDRKHYFNLPSDLPQTDQRHPIRQLFPPPLQQAIIIWGFRAGLLINAPTEQSMLPGNAAKKHFRKILKQEHFIRRLNWSVGLRLIVKLRDAGVVVQRSTVIKALQMMFIVLFGRGRSSKKQNRMMEYANNMSYHDYAREVNRIWGEPLFYLPDLRQERLSARTLWHPNMHDRRVLRENCCSRDSVYLKTKCRSSKAP
ncbi:hypothetical protein BDV96DRAFT_577595 [Lophiotrema nucula]|uniref:Pentatricopeptide repeat domain-containing protein n=1 Tax=Lophiotrema nucula TaxID=690887 RepID=A0A6A5Z528_9PLEO|nr:hypothetical protein BDV96DRAFT_577595 [Lophiotrema nucula]